MRFSRTQTCVTPICVTPTSSVRLWTAFDGTARFSTAHRWLTDKLYFDELYGATVVAGTYAVSRLSFWFDRTVVDGLVNGSAAVTVFSSWLSALIDRRGVDGVVNGVGNTLHDASFGFRRMHTGLTQNYALAMVLGVVVFVGVYLVVR